MYSKHMKAILKSNGFTVSICVCEYSITQYSRIETHHACLDVCFIVN